MVDQKILDNLLIRLLQQQRQPLNTLTNLLVVLNLFVNDVKVHIVERSMHHDDEIAAVVGVVVAVAVDAVAAVDVVVVDDDVVILVIGVHLSHLVVDVAAAVDGGVNDCYYYFH